MGAMEMMGISMAGNRPQWMDSPEMFLDYKHYNDPNIDIYLNSNLPFKKAVLEEVQRRTELKKSDPSYMPYNPFDPADQAMLKAHQDLAITQAIIENPTALAEKDIPASLKPAIQAGIDLVLKKDPNAYADKVIPESLNPNYAKNFMTALDIFSKPKKSYVAVGVGVGAIVLIYFMMRKK